jgi:hypothetical protein
VPVVTVEELADEDGGPPTAAVPMGELFAPEEGAELDAAAQRAERLALFADSEDSSFGRLGDDEDAAMRAFFESDPDTGGGRSRWGFGRRR